MSDYLKDRAATDALAKSLLPDDEMQHLVSCSAPIPSGKNHGLLTCREDVVVKSIRHATAKAAGARIAELETQLAAEVERLDFVLGKYAYCAKFSRRMNASGEISAGYQLIISDEEVDCIALSGEDVNHPTPRAAIDAAIALAKGGK